MADTLFLLVSTDAVSNCVKVNFLLTKRSGKNIVLVIQSCTHL